MAETQTQIQVRLVLEKQCRELAVEIRKMLPAGTAFALMIADFGVKGNLAYVSNADRSDMIKMVKEWLERQEATR